MAGLIGIDFGTTNSVVAIPGAGGRITTARLPLGPDTLDTFRTVLCFWEDRGAGNALRHAAGPEAIRAYLDDAPDSRLVMSMKTYLAQRSFTETRILGRAMTLEALVALFLRALLRAADLDPGTARVVAGRPVRFAGETADDALGEARLRAAFAEAGIGRVEVVLEPEAAGYRFARTLRGAATVLIGDFGGGTSDFSLLRFEPGGPGRVAALGHAGIGIAGDAFDYRIIDRVVSPRLGKGDTYKVLGKELPVPPEYFSAFARWHRLSLMRTLREIEDVARLSAHPERLRALIRLIEGPFELRACRLRPVLNGFGRLAEGEPHPNVATALRKRRSGPDQKLRVGHDDGERALRGVPRRSTVAHALRWWLPVRPGSLPCPGFTGPSKRLLLPHVPEGIGRPVHGFRPLSCGPGRVVHDAERVREFEPR